MKTLTDQIPQIEGQRRERLGKHATARVRAQGHLPVVIYGHQQDPLHIWVDQKAFSHLLHSHAHLVQVVTEGQTESCLIKDVQWNHLGSQILHADLARVDLTERVTISVDLELVGEPTGLKQSGAFLQHPVDAIEISCLASQIPDRIRVDVSSLQVGQSLTVADLQLPPGVTADDDPETVIASIHVVAEEPEEAQAPAAVGSEPEVIGKKEAGPKDQG